MALYTRGVPVRVIESGVETTLTKAMLAADVLDQVGGAEAVRGPAGAPGPQGDPGSPGAAGPGVPAGGATGQLLAKSGSADYATGWVTPTAAVGSVVHDDDDMVPRPRGYSQVLWIGSVPPANGAAGDLWIRTAG
jgi:hypothetical protein